jgi:UDP:flavonoid glycosyltransferase YjiC (YdhE family)
VTPTILFLPFHGVGHFNGVFGIARALNETHAVMFAGSGFFGPHVRTFGFNYRILNTLPFGLGLESWIHEIRKSKYPRLSNIRDRWDDRLYIERKKELTALIEELKPVHVLVDIQQATDVIVLKSIDPNLRVSAISVAPPYYLIPDIPPANSTAMPGEIEKIKEAHKAARATIEANTWRQRFRYLGMDDRWLIKRRLRRNGMMRFKSQYDSLIALALNNVDQYVLTYREFDFVSDKIPGLRYVGPHTYTESNNADTSHFKKIIDEAKSGDRRIIYCSFGTVPNKRDIVGFLNKVANTTQKLSCTVIVSSRLDVITKNKVNSGEHMHIFDWVPQSFVLQHSDAFITHGGINSVHDGIRNHVPMLVCPIELRYDQNGNGARVKYAGLGLLGDIDACTAAEIEAKLSSLLNDDRFRNALRDFNMKTAYYKIDDLLSRIV